MLGRGPSCGLLGFDYNDLVEAIVPRIDHRDISLTLRLRVIKVCFPLYRVMRGSEVMLQAILPGMVDRLLRLMLAYCDFRYISLDRRALVVP